jgi:hypothetical protein
VEGSALSDSPMSAIRRRLAHDRTLLTEGCSYQKSQRDFDLDAFSKISLSYYIISVRGGSTASRPYLYSKVLWTLYIDGDNKLIHKPTNLKTVCTKHSMLSLRDEMLLAARVLSKWRSFDIIWRVVR